MHVRWRGFELCPQLLTYIKYIYIIRLFECFFLPSLGMGRDPLGPNEVSRMCRGGDIGRWARCTRERHTHRARCVHRVMDTEKHLESNLT